MLKLPSISAYDGVQLVLFVWIFNEMLFVSYFHYQFDISLLLIYAKMGAFLSGRLLIFVLISIIIHHKSA